MAVVTVGEGRGGVFLGGAEIACALGDAAGATAALKGWWRRCGCFWPRLGSRGGRWRRRTVGIAGGGGASSGGGCDELAGVVQETIKDLMSETLDEAVVLGPGIAGDAAKHFIRGVEDLVLLHIDAPDHGEQAIKCLNAEVVVHAHGLFAQHVFHALGDELL